MFSVDQTHSEVTEKNFDKCLIISRTSINHSQDESNRQLYEHLEMKRMGLPTQFSNSKLKRLSCRNSHYRKKTFNYESIKMLNQFKVDALLDNDNCNNDNDLTKHCMAEQDEAIIQNDKYFERNKPLDSDIEDIVDEFPSIILSCNSFDNEDQMCSIQSEMINLNNLEYDNDEMDLDFIPMKSKKKKNKAKARHNVYWQQRFILFSRFNEGIKLDKESWFSVTPEAIARHIAERVENVLSKRYPNRKFFVMDPFCGAGGNVIQFALQPHIQKVFAIDIDPKKIAIAKHNASIYNCENKIEFIIGDFFQIVQHNNFDKLIDVCFFSPPWGGPDYIKINKYSLNNMTPNGFDICRHTSKYLTKNIVMLLPRNFDEDELQDISQLVYNIDPDLPVKQYRVVELEKNMIFNKIKTKTAYFGDTINDLKEWPKKVLFE